MGRAMGGVLMTSVVLVVAGCGGSSSSSSSASTPPSSSTAATAQSSSTTSSSPAPAAGGETVHLSAVPGKLAFNTKKLKAKAGTVTLSMSNPSTFSHGIAVEGNGVDKDGQIVQHRGTSTVTAKLKPGTYTFYCPVPGHRQAGMQGTLTVT
jgi:plastocyanin